MSMTDPISDMLTRIRNANLRKHRTVKIPFSQLKERILQVILKEGFIDAYKVEQEVYKTLEVTLKYDSDKLPVIRKLKRESRPGRRIYSPLNKLGSVMNGQGIYIVSTSKGVLSDNECRSQGVSGEVLCSIY